MNTQNKQLIKTLLKVHKQGSVSAKVTADAIYRIIKNETK